MMKARTIFQAAVTVVFLTGTALTVRAQDPIVGGGPPVPLYSADALEQMLRPIALYPDPLLAEIFTAATLPSQIVLADRYINDGGDLTQLAAQPWDPSVRSLAHYPTVLKWLDDNLAWTTEVGQAFLNQPDEVTTAIQHLRYLAQSEGNLTSTSQENVVNNGGDVEIEPVNPEIIYVPTYPWDTIYYNPGIYCSFGVGFPVGIWLTHDWDWKRHHVFAWGPGHLRPANWWTRPARDRVPPRGVAVWRGPVRGSSGAVARGADRGWSPETFRPARVSSPSTPAPLAVNRNTTTARDNRPGTAPGFSGDFRVSPTPAGSPPGVNRPGTAPGFSSGFRVSPTPSGSPPDVSHAVPPFRGPPGGSSFGSGGAFGSSESTFDAHQSSIRAADSRSTMAPPAPAPSAPARSFTPPPSAPARSYAPAPAPAPAPQPSHSSQPSQPPQPSGSRGR